jgi:hypothetical protein
MLEIVNIKNMGTSWALDPLSVEPVARVVRLKYFGNVAVIYNAILFPPVVLIIK